MTGHGTWPWVRRTCLLVATVVLATGCQGGEPDSAADDSPSLPVSASSAESPTGDGPVSPSASESPTVQPASGPRLELDLVSVRVPTGWRKGAATTFTATAAEPNAGGFVALGEILEGARSLEQALRELTDDLTDVERQPSLTLDGEPVWHVTAKELGNPVELFVANPQGARVYIEFNFTPGILSKAEQREIVDSVIASFELK